MTARAVRLEPYFFAPEKTPTCPPLNFSFLFFPFPLFFSSVGLSLLPRHFPARRPRRAPLFPGHEDDGATDRPTHQPSDRQKRVRTRHHQPRTVTYAEAQLIHSVSSFQSAYWNASWFWKLAPVACTPQPSAPCWYSSLKSPGRLRRRILASQVRFHML